MAEFVEDRGRSTEIVSGWRSSLFALAAALCWAVSPVFIRRGLRDLPSPLLGVTIGMSACVVAYGIVLLVRRRHRSRAPISRNALFFQFAAGAVVGLATWVRYVALDLAPVAVVIALGRVSAPTVILLAPIIVGRQAERVTARVWLGAGFIVAGSAILILYA